MGDPSTRSLLSSAPADPKLIGQLRLMLSSERTAAARIGAPGSAARREAEDNAAALERAIFLLSSAPGWRSDKIGNTPIRTVLTTSADMLDEAAKAMGGLVDMPVMAKKLRELAALSTPIQGNGSSGVQAEALPSVGLTGGSPLEGRPIIGKGLRRKLEGETVWNLPVAGYRWKTPIPAELQGSEWAYSYASHWSTGPEDAERLFTQADVRALLDLALSSEVERQTSAEGRTGKEASR